VRSEEIGNVPDGQAAVCELAPENLEPMAWDLIGGGDEMKVRLLPVRVAERAVDVAAGRS